MKYWINKTGNIGTYSRAPSDEAEKPVQENTQKNKDLAPISIVQKGKIVYANNAMKKKIGCQHARQLYGRYFISFVHPSSRNEIIKLLESIELRLPSTITHGLFSKLDGTTFFGELSSFTFLFNGQPAGYIKLKEITR